MMINLWHLLSNCRIFVKFVPKSSVDICKICIIEFPINRTKFCILQQYLGMRRVASSKRAPFTRSQLTLYISSKARSVGLRQQRRLTYAFSSLSALVEVCCTKLLPKISPASDQGPPTPAVERWRDEASLSPAPKPDISAMKSSGFYF